MTSGNRKGHFSEVDGQGSVSPWFGETGEHSAKFKLLERLRSLASKSLVFIDVTFLLYCPTTLPVSLWPPSQHQGHATLGPGSKGQENPSDLSLLGMILCLSPPFLGS